MHDRVRGLPVHERPEAQEVPRLSVWRGTGEADRIRRRDNIQGTGLLRHGLQEPVLQAGQGGSEVAQKLAIDPVR